MIQDIAPHIYHNEMQFCAPRQDDLVLHFLPDDRLYYSLSEGALRYPTVRECGAAPDSLTYLFSIDETAYFLLTRDEPLAKQNGFSYAPARALRALAVGAHMYAAAVGGSLWRWYTHQKFCGACGATMEKSKIERAMVCPVCGNTVYPKICPAIICAVYDGERLLLTRYRDRAFTKYALIAGFHEIGETIEQTVHREVMEETGLKVKNLRFYKSQPWVYTDSLLMGFFAELDGSDKITLQQSELSEAAWFSRGEIPHDHSGISLTGEMIERFRAENFPQETFRASSLFV